jgi:uncharacterized Zn finger protein
MSGVLIPRSVHPAPAGYYILAERFDEDPFWILAWRGRDKDELLGRLRAQRGAGNQHRSAGF